jgi:hypothetical protein
MGSRSGAGLLALIVAGLAAAACLGAAALGAAMVGGQSAPIPQAVPGIPAEYLSAYQAASARFELGADGWSYLAAVGKVESDHGRSQAPGVHAGQNAFGCCAGPMQIHNGFGSGDGTWGAYAADGNGDGVKDIYSPSDAIATAARYLRASGAPADWRAALFAYNHAGWYVEQVLTQARAYREAALVDPSPSGVWLAPLPSFPGERCDSRIVAEVEQLSRAYGLRVSDCFGGAPHKTNGEHPLGLAVDWVPADGNWTRTERLARAAGWRPACAPAGCPGGPFRVVLYNGYPGHGDPAHSGSPHLHVSWLHGPAQPFTRASWVRLVLAVP